MVLRISGIALVLALWIGGLCLPLAQAAPKAQLSDYLPPVYDDDTRRAAGWQSIEEGFTPDPSDKAAPVLLFYVTADNAEPPGDILSDALKRVNLPEAEMTPLSEIETFTFLTGGRGWTSAGQGTVAGVPQSVFFIYAYDRARRGYSVQLYRAPREVWAGWGGVRVALVNAGLAQELNRLSSDVLSLLGRADPAQQVQIFNGLIDIAVADAFTGEATQVQGAVERIEAVARDLQAQAECGVPGNCASAAPEGAGQAKAGYAPR